jgi:hypothetical protein
VAVAGKPTRARPRSALVALATLLAVVTITIDFPDADQGWHTYTLYWTQSRISVYYDRQLALTTTSGLPQQAMYLLHATHMPPCGDTGSSMRGPQRQHSTGKVRHGHYAIQRSGGNHPRGHG